MKRTSLAVAVAIALLASGAAAQIDPGGGPIGVNGDALDLDQEAGRISYIGRAEVTQGDNRLRSDRIDAYSEGDGEGLGSGVDRIEAIGNVYFVTPEQTMRGDRAVFVVATNTITVTGDVILSQGRNVITGSRLTYNTETGRARMEGAPTAAGNRVRGVFYPEGEN